MRSPRTLLMGSWSVRHSRLPSRSKHATRSLR
jgi:hypothetical protein